MQINISKNTNSVSQNKNLILILRDFKPKIEQLIELGVFGHTQNNTISYYIPKLARSDNSFKLKSRVTEHYRNLVYCKTQISSTTIWSPSVNSKPWSQSLFFYFFLIASAQNTFFLSASELVQKIMLLKILLTTLKDEWKKLKGKPKDKRKENN